MTPVVLSEAQRQAVEWSGGPLLVLAGPGAGKTEVLARRMVRILRATPKRRFRVLGLSFTTLAADEMKRRVALALGRESERARTATFHSFCAEVLRQHGSHLGLRPDFRILTLDADRAVVLADALGSRAPWGNQPPPAERIARNLDRLLQADPNDGNGASTREARLEVWGAALLDAYVARLIENNCMDFGSLLFCCLRLMRDRPRIAGDFPVAYPHVLVDEYQDTNAIQARLLRQIWSPGRCELFAVADDDQMIYRWNGASPERITDLKTDYGMTVLRLPESHRCPVGVVERANRLMAAGPDSPLGRAPVVAASSDGDGTGSVRLYRCADEQAETRWVARDLRQRGIASAGCAVLARTGRLVDAAHRALLRDGIPAWCRKPRDEFVSPGVRFLLAALRLANTPDDGAQLRLLARALDEVSGAGPLPGSVESAARIGNGALLTAFVSVAEDAPGSPPGSQLIGAVRDHLVTRPDHRRFLAVALDSLESDAKRGDAAEQTAAREEIHIWRQLSAHIRSRTGDPARLDQFLHELDLRPIVPEPGPGEVQCLTIHQAKGKGFRHVYLIGMAEDLLPSYHATKIGAAATAIDDERRTCFVAITRASETLTLTRAKSYYGWEKARSRFLAEMGLTSGGDDE